MNHRFLQLHVLTAYGPSNLNRDDVGMPKTAMLGTVPRLRVSSQSLKRAWRNSDYFKQALSGHLGTRTKRIGQIALDAMLIANPELDKSEAFEWSKLIAQAFGKLASKKSAEAGDAADEPEDEGEPEAAPSKKPSKAKAKAGGSKQSKDATSLNSVETLVFLTRDEVLAIEALARTLAQSKKAPEAAQLQLLRKQHASVDVALFGRMLTSEKGVKESNDRPAFSVEAAAQVAHAVTVHRATPEDDYFTAVDDLSRDEETGSAHLGDLGFGSGVFYLYLCIDRQLLVDNLGGDHALAQRALSALCQCAVSVAPTGKQKSFASNARASFALAELSSEQPRQLSAAFLKPVQDSERRSEDVAQLAVERLADLVSRFDQAYGFEGQRLCLNVTGAKVDALDRNVTVSDEPRLIQLCRLCGQGLEPAP